MPLALDRDYLADETATVERLIAATALSDEASVAICEQAAALVEGVRRRKDEQSALDAFMHEYDLSSDEGVLLMCLAEALLRIPDEDTAEKLIADKLGDANWQSHLGRSESLFVNASTWGLMLTGRIIRVPIRDAKAWRGMLDKLIAGSSEPVIRTALRQAMRMMGSQFVMGRTIDEALKRAGKASGPRVRHSFDMLGEAALTASDAQRYFDAYTNAIKAIGTRLGKAGDVISGPGISVKLSALHPRYEYSQRERVLAEVPDRLLALCEAARNANIGLTVDAEEADRLEMALAVFEQVYRHPTNRGWDGLGLACQAYQKRALPQIEWLVDLGRELGRRIPVRLVKGAYWDTEIKRSQEQGLAGYPVFTRKCTTDVSYLACARGLLAARDVIYPQFATHNAHTVAAIRAFADDGQRDRPRDSYEFQRLHGMGESLYEEVQSRYANVGCRVYAPVGSHEDLLPYLVRRLLENGANTSFVNRILDESIPVSEVVNDPVGELRSVASKPHPGIPLPTGIYADRKNSSGLNLAVVSERRVVADAIATLDRSPPLAQPSTSADQPTTPRVNVTCPANLLRHVGAWHEATPDDVHRAAHRARTAFRNWGGCDVEQRAKILEAVADGLEAQRANLMALLIREAGKTYADAQAEVREAADFCRYYAARARELMGEATRLPGYTGETNTLRHAPRGVMVCISPWNFPLAIFTGQIAAALVTGNCVLAKPAEQTTLIANAAIAVFRNCGLPADVLHLLPGTGEVIGPSLLGVPDLAGALFTGSLDTARQIARQLAERNGAIVPLIAETGGLNTMIVDSSALPEQVVKDAVQSAFGSAGQRCSALRVLCVQDDIAERILPMLAGAMQELRVGDPVDFTTDIGPVIDTEALGRLRTHRERMDREARRLAAVPSANASGHFFPPVAYEVDSLDQVGGEVFGPVLHVLRYDDEELDQLVDDINALGYGLTLGVHSRIESTWKRVSELARVGNCYINRTMIGAVVGVQPFGGEGLSGTGPKAGGPDYLRRLTTERTVTINTAAVGGNAHLLTLE